MVCASKIVHFIVPLSGPIVQEKAQELAISLGKLDFKASNGWLDSFRATRNVVWSSVVGESNDVDMEIVEWKCMVQVKIKDYQPCDIYNGDETGMYFRALLSKTLCVKGENCKGGKHSKERLTIFICGNMAGELLKPLVIGKSALPRCFKNVEIEKLPAKWIHSKKAWNTASIMEEWLKSFNAEMKRKNRKVILFLDIATCHPKIHLTNVELGFRQTQQASLSQWIRE
ncbi:tigger transposable element-derived protein 6-like [Ischnura elegans]|uniref:tigger transposable element-derived protein 6-like n=1 Tax=Ischnura elegans TaxID=197161 RepID=UPI001ED8B5A6|nr:tigger transposable element-derived protein 6-like [Ischnura elegans]